MGNCRSAENRSSKKNDYASSRNACRTYQRLRWGLGAQPAREKFRRSDAVADKQQVRPISKRQHRTLISIAWCCRATLSGNPHPELRSVRAAGCSFVQQDQILCLAVGCGPAQSSETHSTIRCDLQVSSGLLTQKPAARSACIL